MHNPEETRPSATRELQSQRGEVRTELLAIPTVGLALCTRLFSGLCLTAVVGGSGCFAVATAMSASSLQHSRSWHLSTASISLFHLARIIREGGRSTGCGWGEGGEVSSKPLSVNRRCQQSLKCTTSSRPALMRCEVGTLSAARQTDPNPSQANMLAYVFASSTLRTASVLEKTAE